MPILVSYIERIVSRIRIPFWGWVGIFLFVVFLRWVIEGVFGLGIEGGLLPATSFLHYALWFGTVFLFSSVLIAFFSGSKNVVLPLKLLVLLSPAMLFPVPLSSLFGLDARSAASYLSFYGLEGFWSIFPSFLFDTSLSIFLRLEVVGSVVGAAFLVYVLSSRMKILRTIFALLVSYVLLLCAGAIPSILALFQGAGRLYEKAFLFDLFYNRATSLLVGVGYFDAPSLLSLNQWIDLAISSVLFPFFVLSAGAVLWARFPQLFFPLLKNARLRKGFDFFVATLSGVVVGVVLLGVPFSFHVLNIFALVNILLVALLFYGAVAFFDDAFDIAIDKIAHPLRPLPQKQISRRSVFWIAAGCALLSLVGALIISAVLFVAVMASLVCAFLYSAPPLRFKRFFGINIFLIVFAFLAFALAGFFTAFPGKTFFDIPLLYYGYGTACMMILVSLKDIPDASGDIAGGISTLPALIGVRAAQHTLGTFLALLIVATPLLFGKGNIYMSVASYVFAPLLYYFVSREKYSERVLYIVGVGCVASLFVAFLFG